MVHVIQTKVTKVILWSNKVLGFKCGGETEEESPWKSKLIAVFRFLQSSYIWAWCLAVWIPLHTDPKQMMPYVSEVWSSTFSLSEYNRFITFVSDSRVGKTPLRLNIPFSMFSCYLNALLCSYINPQTLIHHQAETLERFSMCKNKIHFICMCSIRMQYSLYTLPFKLILLLIL